MMNYLIRQIQWLSFHPGANDAQISSVESSLRAQFSDQYRELLKHMNGANGRTNAGENICFFGTAELPEINASAATEEFVSDWFIFASDLGGKSYLMRRFRDSDVIVSCFDEVLSTEEMRHEAADLFDFLRKLGGGEQTFQDSSVRRG